MSREVLIIALLVVVLLIAVVQMFQLMQMSTEITGYVAQTSGQITTGQTTSQITGQAALPAQRGGC